MVNYQDLFYIDGVILKSIVDTIPPGTYNISVSLVPTGFVISQWYSGLRPLLRHYLFRDNNDKKSQILCENDQEIDSSSYKSKVFYQGLTINVAAMEKQGNILKCLFRNENWVNSTTEREQKWTFRQHESPTESCVTPTGSTSLYIGVSLSSCFLILVCICVAVYKQKRLKKRLTKREDTVILNPIYSKVRQYSILIFFISKSSRRLKNGDYNIIYPLRFLTAKCVPILKGFKNIGDYYNVFKTSQYILQIRGVLQLFILTLNKTSHTQEFKGYYIYESDLKVHTDVILGRGNFGRVYMGDAKNTRYIYYNVFLFL